MKRTAAHSEASDGDGLLHSNSKLVHTSQSDHANGTGLENDRSDRSSSSSGRSTAICNATSGTDGCFQVYPVSRFGGNFPYFRQPCEIGSYSIDEQGTFVHDRSQLRIYVPPTNPNDVCFDLNLGYDTFIKKDEDSGERLDHLLRWLSLNKEKFRLTGQTQISSLNTDFVCYRGLVTRLVCTPYENRDAWKIAVTLHKGSYYMYEYDTEQKKVQKQNMSQKEKEMTYWGHKFEQYVTAEKTDGLTPVPNTRCPVNNHAQFGSVVRTRLSSHSLVFAGEVDCCHAKDQSKYIELKTNRELYEPKNLHNFKKFKLLKWWAQSFLIGIGTIIGGFRDDHGVVHRLEAFNTCGIPKQCREVKNCWDPVVCFNFCDQFLQYVKDTVKEDDPRVVHMFTYSPGHTVRWQRCDPGSEYCFLPDWYLTAMDQENTT